MRRLRASCLAPLARITGVLSPRTTDRHVGRIARPVGRAPAVAPIVTVRSRCALRSALLVLPLALNAVQPARAQSSPGDEAGPREGAYETLLQATLRPSADAQLELRLLRITLDADGRSPRHTHPGLEFGVVEAGRLLVEVDDRAIRRGAEPDAESETVEPGTEVELVAGDRIAYAPGTEMTFHNPGPGPATLLAATVLPVGPDAPPGAAYADGPPTQQEVAGVSSQILGVAVVDADRFSETAAAVVLERLAPTGGDPIPAFAGPVLLTVDQGTIAGALVQGSAVVASAAAATADSSRFDIGPGDAIFFPVGMAETAPLGGEGEAVILRLGLVPLAADAPAIAADAEAGRSPARATSPAANEEDDDPSPVTDAAFAPGSQVIVAVDEARLRAAPSIDGALVAALERGRLLLVAGEPVAADGYDWYPVEDPTDPTLTGFVAGELLAGV